MKKCKLCSRPILKKKAENEKVFRRKKYCSSTCYKADPKKKKRPVGWMNGMFAGNRA